MFFSLRKGGHKEQFSFVAIAAHKFRGPLTVLRGSLEMLADERSSKLSDEQRELVDQMEKATRRLLGMVEDMRDVVAIETHTLTLHPETLHIDKVIEEVINEQALYAKRHNVALRYVPAVTPLPSVMGDKERMRQFFTIFVDNGVRYSRPGTEQSWIEIRADVRDKEIVIAVEDNGIGIPPEDQSSIFTKFFRASNAEPFSSAGTGLGLYIAKALIEKSGGKIQFTSKVGQGTTFTCILPLS